MSRIIFTKAMKKEYVILAPQMLPLHFRFLQTCFRYEGYKLEILKTKHQKIVDTGLTYVHNDTCYPALLVIGQMIEALLSGNYDTHKTALLITQTGGGCRASNYIHLLRKALIKAGLSYVPVISLSIGNMEKNPGFKLSFNNIKKLNAGLMYADTLMWVSNYKRAHEAKRGETDALLDTFMDEFDHDFITRKKIKAIEVRENLKRIVTTFDKIAEHKMLVKKVGIVGEIYVKFAPLGNNDLQDFLEKNKVEVVLPGLYDFLIFKIDNRITDIELYGGSFIKKFIYKKMYKLLLKWQNAMIDATKLAKSIPSLSSYLHLKESVKPYVGLGNKMGEGWLLLAEMLDLIEIGARNIVCAQPFGCLPNHIIGKGMLKKIKENHPDSNIMPIDYDPGASKVNQENRIRLMLANAK